ncbi:MAG: SCP2 sterol-binding domain-containing protein [Mycobacterium leprae]
MTVAAIFQNIRERAQAGDPKLAALNASYQFNLTGEGGGVFHAVLQQGTIDIGEGAAAAPGCTVTMSAADFEALVAGKLNTTMAFMTGKIKVDGSMGLALKLQSVLG